MFDEICPRCGRNKVGRTINNLYGGSAVISFGECKYCFSDIDSNSERLSKVKELIEWMMGDLQAVKDRGANFLTALGCFTYTEAIGLYLPQLDIKQTGEQFCKDNKRAMRFYRCLFRLDSGKYLIECDKKIRESGVKNGIYQIRHRFAHKYLPNLVMPQQIVVRVIGSKNLEALENLKTNKLFSPIIFSESNQEKEIIINNIKYIEELRRLVNFIYKKIFTEAESEFVDAMKLGYADLLKDD
jgi:hypothetical protein